MHSIIALYGNFMCALQLTLSSLSGQACE